MCKGAAICLHLLSYDAIHFRRKPLMDRSTFINALFLCLLNVIFMIAGIFLNSVVIISLRRSSQLRKKLCYFMILLLSCFDLAVVAINHPISIFRTILWPMNTRQDEGKLTKWIIVTVSALTGFSLSMLLTLTLERFLALKYPFFHQTAVTKKRLVCFLAFSMVITMSISSSLFFDRRIYGSALIVFVSSFFSLFIYFNYNMFIIAKGKSTAATTHGQESDGLKFNLKLISACSMAVGCFFICFSPIMVHWILYLTSDVLWYDPPSQILRIWSATLLAMNSTFNCLIFFWRISMLRREGMKTVKCFRSARS